MSVESPSSIDPLCEVRSFELERVRNEAKIEMVWWGDNAIRNVREALRAGTLVKVPNEWTIEGSGFRLIRNLRDGTEPNLLSPQAYGLLKLLVKRWRDDIRGYRLNTLDVLLSLTSLYRTRKIQKRLIAQGANAAMFSSHEAGMAFDIDPVGYYEGEERKAVNWKMQPFKDDYREILLHNLNSLEHARYCHVIYEMGYSLEDGKVVGHDSCYHVCVSPKFL